MSIPGSWRAMNREKGRSAELWLRARGCGGPVVNSPRTVCQMQMCYLNGVFRPVRVDLLCRLFC